MTTRRGQDMSSADHAATVGAITRGQDLGLQEAMMRSADSRYGTDVGANTQRYGQNLAADTQTYGDNLAAFMQGRAQDMSLYEHKLAADAAGYKAQSEAEDRARQYALDEAKYKDQQLQERADREAQQALYEGQQEAQDANWFGTGLGTASSDEGLQRALPKLAAIQPRLGIAPKGTMNLYYPSQKPQ